MIAPLAFLLARSATARTRRARERDAAELRADFDFVWRRLAEFVGLGHTVVAAAGPTIVTPSLVNVDTTGGRLVLVVKLLPGQLPEHIAAVADQLAPGLGAHRVRIEPRGLHWVRIELLAADPLQVDVATPTDQADHDFATVQTVRVLIAQDEAREQIAMTWVEAPHVCVQGATRSGKSVWCYSVLAQLAGLPDVLIAGSDPSGLLLGRPFVGTRHHDWQATGSGDVLAHLELLRRLVAEMDQRIAALPDRADKWERFTPSRPLVLVVLEEFAGLLRLASTLPTPRGEAKIRDQLLALYGRLVSEGHKAGFRLLVITQRADATVIGGFERGQLGIKISFRVADRDAVPMLHGEDARALADDHRHAPPGVALLETPTEPVRRVRGPRLLGPSEDADYARYWDEIAAAAARLPRLAA